MTLESGRRLCVLMEAGTSRFAVEATSVVEISPPDADGQRLRGVLELQDLSVLLGGEAEQRPGLAAVLDTSPTLAVRVRQVVEVADVAKSPFFQLPPGLGERLPALVRGAVLHRERLYLELTVEALVPLGREAPQVPARVPHILETPPDRALVFESQGTAYALPLALVLQVISGDQAYCPLPATGGPVAGLLAHGQALWPVYSVPGLLGGRSYREPLFILAELAGHHVALCASRALGVQAQFDGLFLDFQRMFS